MALYAMGDFHLAFSTGKTMEVFGKEWKDYVNRIGNVFARRIQL